MLAPVDVLRRADRDGYAVPAFNFSDIWDIQAIVEAAVEEDAVIMLAANPLVMKALGVEICAAVSRISAKEATAAILPHQDHAFRVEDCLAAIKAGYSSVMMDASKFPLDENIKMVRNVVEAAHAKGGIVEAEVGHIRGKGIEGEYTGADFLADPCACFELVQKSKCDSLAIGIGNAHGFYTGKPELRFDRLEEINKTIDVPLVLHGGTGIPAEDIRQAIKLGINKVNVGTIIHCSYMNALKDELNRLGPNPYTLDVMPPVKEKIKDVVKEWIRICMCNGRAKYYRMM